MKCKECKGKMRTIIVKHIPLTIKNELAEEIHKLTKE